MTNRGAFVRKIDLAEALELYEIRAALVSQAGRLVAQRGSEANIRGLRRLNDEWLKELSHTMSISMRH